jgi:hypothetical protein
MPSPSIEQFLELQEQVISLGRLLEQLVSAMESLTQAMHLSTTILKDHHRMLGGKFNTDTPWTPPQPDKVA